MVKFDDTQFYLSFPENYFKQIKEKYFDYCHIKRKEVNEPGYIECTCYYIEKFPEMIITIDEYTYPINLKTITIKENKRCKLFILKRELIILRIKSSINRKSIIIHN